ncbi:MAG: molybdate ABC transporter substrate-binding protein [Pseudomonadota bacterium]
MGKLARTLLCLTLVVAVSASGQAKERALTVFAAASTGTALTEIARAWEAETGNDVTLSFAGSSTLARQIAAGAPADVFVSANTAWMDSLAAEGRLAPGTRVDLLGNSLVLIGPAGAAPVDLTAATGLASRLGTERLAMALVDAVPAGIYGKAALTALGLWEGISTQVAQTDNVRAALALVAVGATPLGIVYGSDARAEPRVSALATFPPESHPPIVYPAAATAAGDPARARAFLAHLKSAPARAVFEAQGFTPLGPVP